ncbi:MAG: phytanoyl-CoA dioxygenase family protein [Acidimicrobiales bacterium]
MQSTTTTATAATTTGRTTPEPELGRLLERAAGALSHSHPELAAELSDRAARAHEPGDPFDSLTGDGQVDRFRTFGYLVLRGFFDRPLVDELRAEVIGTIRAVHGDRYREHPPLSGMAGHYTCLLGPWAPRTVELVDSRRLVRLAERLVGGWALPSPCDTQGILYFDHAPWHNDSGIAIRGVKFVAYLEPLDAGSGALRVLPASHRLADDALGHLYSLDLDVPDVPGQVLATQPGDVVVFDPLLYHASWAGRDRLQWSTMYVRDAVTPSWRPGLLEWFADGARYADELPEGHRPFDRSWVADGSGDLQDRRFDQRHRWMYRLNELGVLDTFGVADAFRP